MLPPGHRAVSLRNVGLRTRVVVDDKDRGRAVEKVLLT